MTEEIIFVVPFSKIEILNDWFLKSQIDYAHIIKIPLNKNKIAANELNQFLDKLPENKWIVFCDEWVQIVNDVRPILQGRNKNFLYGITGARIDKNSLKLQKCDGRSGFQELDNEKVDSIGQGCMIAHSSALIKNGIKFDEKFEEKYIVDFSLQWQNKIGKVAIIPLKCNFLPRVIPFKKEKLFMKKLREKYSNLLPLGLWAGTLTDDSKFDEQTFLDQRDSWIQNLLNEKIELKSIINKLQKEFEERSTWAESLDEQLKQKGQEMANFQNEYDEKNAWAVSLDKQLKQKSALESKIYQYEKILSKFSDSQKTLGKLSKNSKNDSSNIVNDIYNQLESKLVWIFGSPRSGSSWLALNILRREGIRALDETMFGAQLGAFYDNPSIHWNLMQGRYKAKFTRIIDRDRDELFFSSKYENEWKESLRFLILNRIKVQLGYMRYNHIVLKAPNESHASDILLKCLPNSKLIFLVRDGRDVIDSRQGKFQNPRGKKSIPETPEERKFRISHFAMMWNLMIQTTQKAYDSHNPKLRLLVKYEDLRFEPQKEIEKIYKFLGNDLSKEEINKIVKETKFENIPDELKGLDKNIRKATPGSYKEYFSKEELKIANKIMKDNLIKYGYKL